MNSRCSGARQITGVEASRTALVHFLGAERQGLACTSGLAPSRALMVKSATPLLWAGRWVWNRRGPAFEPSGVLC